MTIVVVNLDRDADRLAYMRRQLDRQGLAFTRFPGILGAALPENVRRFFPREEDGTGFLSKGEIGCYASQLAVYEEIAAGRIAAPALVMEDDVEIPSDLSGFLDRLLKALPPDWDIARLTSPAKRAYVTLAAVDQTHALVRYSVSPGSNGALLVSEQGARKFLAETPRTLPIDQDNRTVWRFGLNLYGVVPAPIRGNALDTSTIDALGAGRSRENTARQRVLRRRRALWRRHAWNIKQFGIAAWAASELVNVPVQLLDRRRRPAFLASAGRWLATFAKPPSARP